MEDILEKKSEIDRESFKFKKFYLSQLKKNCNILIIGGKNSGKTLLTKRILDYSGFNENGMDNKPSNGTIFSITEKYEYNFVNCTSVMRYDEYNLDILSTIMNTQRKFLTKFINDKNEKEKKDKESNKEEKELDKTTIIKGENNIEIEFTLDKNKDENYEKESKKRKVISNILSFIGKNDEKDEEFDFYTTADSDMDKEYNEDTKKINKMRSFIIFDKCLNNNFWHRNNCMTNLFYTNSHHLITNIINSRHLLFIPDYLRETLDYVFIFNVKSKESKKFLHRDYFGHIESFEKFERIFDSIMEINPYNCMVLDKTSLGCKIEENIFWYNLEYENNKMKSKIIKNIMDINDYFEKINMDLRQYSELKPAKLNPLAEKII